MSEHSALGSLRNTADQLEELQRRAESLAMRDEDDQLHDAVSTLRFRLGDEWYAVRVAEVREIFHDYEITPIPCVPSFILGVVNVRGEILSVTDPARLMGLGEVVIDPKALPPAVVVAHDDRATALVVDEIGDITEVDAEAIEPPISTIDRNQAEFIAGTIHETSSLVGLMSIEKVLEPVVTGARHERQ
jgi:purine-binding chemotaxis protein CheW